MISNGDEKLFRWGWWFGDGVFTGLLSDLGVG
jgi:hypothetical protein